MSNKRDQRLRALFNAGPEKRYGPRAIAGGPGWEVWDWRHYKPVPDNQIMTIDIDEPRYLS